MKLKSKIKLYKPLIAFNRHRSKKLSKKIKKLNDEKRYSEQFKIKWVLRKAKRILNSFKVITKIHNYDYIPNSATCLFIINYHSFVDLLLLIKAIDDPNGSSINAIPELSFLIEKNFVIDQSIEKYLEILQSFYFKEESFLKNQKDIDQFVKFAKKKSKKIVMLFDGNFKNNDWAQKTNIYKIAKKYNLQIVPVSISNSQKILKINQRSDSINVNIHFHKPIKSMIVNLNSETTLFRMVEKKILSKINNN